MITAVLCIVGSLVVGAGVGGLTVYLRMRQSPSPMVIIDGLTDTDRDEVARDFAVHVSAVQQKVSEFADALADGDADLRDRLRHFENGGGQS